MSVQPGSTIGVYTIDREIGRGGMGVVYLGRDTKLDRPVAVKALPEHLAEDPDRLSRFEREARTLAQLSHPNVAGIYGVEEQDGSRFLVLEYVEGETLAEMLDRGPLTPDEAVDVCAQIASGVEAAHEAGVIHRDLKPANVKVTPSGQVKVLDFGLAKSSESMSSSASGMSQSPTLTAALPQHSPTIPGAILGTAAYMSPEQARGRSVDKRTDIWSFGVILYECLTGAGPFVGETATDSIGAILHKDVDLERLPPATPPSARLVLARCLERDKNLRYRDIGDARMDLVGAGTLAIAPEPAAAPGSRAGVLAAGLLAGLAIGAAGVWFLAGLGAPAPVQTTPVARAEPRRFTIKLPEDAPIAPASAHPFGVGRQFFELSPDGRTLIYTALVDGGMHLYTIDLASGEAEPVRGGEDGFGARFAPDGRQIVFFSNERMFKMDLERRGEPELLADTPSPVGAAWAPDGTLYFSPAEMRPIMSMPSTGGSETPVTQHLVDGGSHKSPFLVPGGEWLLFTGTSHRPMLNVTKLGSVGEQRTLERFASAGRVAPSGHLLFTREDRIMGARFDTAACEMLGEPVTVVSGVRSSFFRGHYSLAGDGTLVYAPGFGDETGRLVWVDRDGNSRRLDAGLRGFHAFDLSPDGRLLAIPVEEGRDTDVWIYDLDRLQTPARLTFGGVHNHCRWSDDGRFLLFAQYEEDGSNVFWAKDSESGAPPFKVLDHPGGAIPLAYHAPTGELLFSRVTPEGGMDLFHVFVDLAQGEGIDAADAVKLRSSPYAEPFAALSPDRQWVVANSDETGRWELYLSSYPEFGSRVQISTSGGEEPYWTEDGSRVIYRWNDEWFEVDITTEPRLSASQPRVITRGPFVNVSGYSWDMTPDGQRLLLLEGPQQDAPITELQVITNFTTELERRLPSP